MKVILLEKISRLGNLGDKVNVKSGFGRNYLIPKGKALPATTANVAFFEAQRADLEENAAKRLESCKARALTLDGLSISIEVNASEEGKLFGSVGVHEIVHALKEMGHELTKNEIRLEAPIRELGDHEVTILLFDEVDVKLQVSVISA